MMIVIVLLIILALIYALLIKPRTSEKPDSDGLKTVYAMRGVISGEYPENSISAFRECINKGIGIELDVRATADNEVVVFHDEGMYRLLGVKKRISDTTLQELKTYGILGTSDTVPTLSEVLEFVDGKVPLMIHFQGMGENIASAVRSVDVLDNYEGKFCVFSKNPYFLDWFCRCRSRFFRITYSTNSLKENKELSFIAKLNSVCHFDNIFIAPDAFAFEEKNKKNLTLYLCKNIYKSYEFVVIDDNSQDVKKYINAGSGVILNNLKWRRK